MDIRSESGSGHHDAGAVHLPAPTAWPMVLALGMALIMTGLVTNGVIGLLGLLLTVLGSVGWFRQVLPVEQHEAVAMQAEQIQIYSTRVSVDRLAIAPSHRKILPIEVFHITTGLKGGIAGGIAMTVPAAIFSLIKYHSIWYAMNLLAAGGFVSWAGASNAFLAQFHPEGLLAGLAIHIVASLLVGLLYGAVLPMFPWKPILTAGFLAPLVWTGLLYSTLNIVSPILDERIDWFWFIMSQVAFGLVAGFVINLQAKVRTAQFQALPFAVRAGLHSDATLKTEERDTPQ